MNVMGNVYLATGLSTVVGMVGKMFVGNNYSGQNVVGITDNVSMDIVWLKPSIILLTIIPIVTYVTDVFLSMAKPIVIYMSMMM